MCDCMEFPDTVEEFMEQYKVVDTDYVYSNGTEFVPIFRMKQWFEHKKGHWEKIENHSLFTHPMSNTYQCPFCGNQLYLLFDTINKYHYCWRCGHDLRESGEENR